MGFSESELAELLRLAPGAQAFEESGTNYYLLPNLRMREGCAPERADVLLCPTPRDGYPFRLFFAQRISSKNSPNWNGVNVPILGRPWHSISLQLPPTRPRLAQIVAIFLKAV